MPTEDFRETDGSGVYIYIYIKTHPRWSCPIARPDSATVTNRHDVGRVQFVQSAYNIAPVPKPARGIVQRVTGVPELNL